MLCDWLARIDHTAVGARLDLLGSACIRQGFNLDLPQQSRPWHSEAARTRAIIMSAIWEESADAE